MRTAIMAAVLCALVVSPAPEQRIQNARGGLFGIGMQNVDVDEMNATLAAHGYPNHDENFLSVGGGFTWWWRHFLLGADLQALLQPSETSGNFETELSGGYALANIGAVARVGDHFVIYPMASVGGGGAEFRIEPRTPITFDQLLTDPGRNTHITNASMLLGPRLGAHYLVRLGRRGNRNGLMVGIRAGYLFSVLDSEWDELEGSSVEGGPALNLGGWHVLLTIGAWRTRSSME